LAADDAFAVSSFQVCVVENQGHWLLAFVAAFRLGPSRHCVDGIVDTVDDVAQTIWIVVGCLDFDGDGAVSDCSGAASIGRRAGCSRCEFDCLGESLQHSAGAFDSEFSWSII
jgi:hypothetical protein